MHRITAAVSAALVLTAAAACADGQDGTDVTGRSAAEASVTAREPAAKPSDYPTETAEPAATSTPGPKTFPMGYKATIFDEDSVDLLHVTIEKPRTVTDEYLKPERGRFLAVTVTYEALRPAQDINPFDLIVTTASGERLTPTFGPQGAGAQLNAATLNSGEKARGTVIFDVPKAGVTGIAYAPAGQVLGTWDL